MVQLAISHRSRAGRTEAVLTDSETIEVYESQAAAWVLTRDPRDLDHVAWVAEHRVTGPVIDIGCGPGWHIATVDPPTVALDATAAMLRMVPDRAPDALRLRASADALPVAPGSLGGAVATRVYLHLPRAALPVALADLHQALRPQAPAFVTFMGDGLGPEWRAGEPFAGRLFTGWPDDLIEAVVRSAGFDVALLASDRPAGEAGSVLMRLRRAFTLPDVVGADMRLLVCGLALLPCASLWGVVDEFFDPLTKLFRIFKPGR